MKTIQDRLLLPLGLAALLLASSCSSSSSGNGTVQETIAALLEGEGLTRLQSALEEADLMDELRTGSLTLFAPTNEAFELLPEGFLDALSREELRNLLLYHVVNTGPVPSSTAFGLSSATMANGDDVIIDQVAGSLFINNGRVVKADIQASNGVIHVIDRVLLPPVDLRATLEFRGLTTLLEVLADEDPESGTLVAPTNEAFAALPEGLLEGMSQPELSAFISYHAIEDPVPASAALNEELVASLNGQKLLFALGVDGLKVNNASMLEINIPVVDGMLHIIDTALLRPGTVAATLTDMEGFSTLVTVLGAASLDVNLNNPGQGPFTVFAPTDAAFEALPPGMLDDLLNEPETPALNQTLQYHVVEGMLTVKDVVAAIGEGIETLEGSSLTVAVTEGGVVTIDGASVLVTNILCSNGIIHAIDAVLFPENGPVLAPGTAVLLQHDGPAAAGAPRRAR